MANAIRHLDEKYRYPALERGIGFSSTSECSCLEILHYKTGDGDLDIECNEGMLSGDVEAKEWIEQEPEQVLGDEEGTGASKKLIGGLRILMGSCELGECKKRLLPFSEETFGTITNRLKLPEQYISSMDSIGGTVDGCALKFSCDLKPKPRCDQDSDRNEWGFNPDICYIARFKIFSCYCYYITISYDKKTNLLYAIVLTKTADHDFASLVEQLQRKRSLALDPMLLPILVANICLHSSSTRVGKQDHRLNDLEEKMGLHEWTNMPGGDLFQIDFVASTRALGAVSRKLSLERMRVEGLLLNLGELWQMVREENVADEIVDDAKRKTTEKDIDELVRHNMNACKNTALRIDWEEKRAQNQISVVFQFMAQKDARVNIQLAETSATIARETKKDGSSMKAIAVLTMCFLPGTFLAALFAMPLFNWDNNDLPITKVGFKYYWAIAIPLTLFVLAVWALAMVVPWKELMIRWRMQAKIRDLEATALKDQ